MPLFSSSFFSKILIFTGKEIFKVALNFVIAKHTFKKMKSMCFNRSNCINVVPIRENQLFGSSFEVSSNRVEGYVFALPSHLCDFRLRRGFPPIFFIVLEIPIYEIQWFHFLTFDVWKFDFPKFDFLKFIERKSKIFNSILKLWIFLYQIFQNLILYYNLNYFLKLILF